MARELARHEYNRERLEYNEEIGNQMSSKKEEMWKPVYEASYSFEPKVLEELNNSMAKRITVLIKANGDTRKYRLDYVGLQCCCVFIGMYQKYVLEFHWNIFDIYIQLLPDCTLIVFMETKWHKQLIIRIVKHRPYMYNKNVKKRLKYSVVK